MTTMNGGRRVLVLVLSLMLVSCATARVKTTPNDSTLNEPATSTAAATATANSTKPSSTTSFVPTAGVRCPAPPFDFPVRNDAESEAFGLEQGALRPEQRIVQEYLAANPDDTFGLEYSFDAPARLQVRVSSRLDEHRATLTKLVAKPEHIEVTLVGYVPADLRRAGAELVAEAQANPGVFSSYSGSDDEGRRPFQLDVGLNAGQEARAATMVERWGPIVRITVGGLPFVPTGCGEQPVMPRCPDIDGLDPVTIGLELTLTVQTPTISASQYGQATLTERNIGTKPVAIGSGQPVVGSIVKPGTKQVVGRFTGAIAGVGGGPNLAPGESGTVAVVFGGARCDGGPGTALPPGTYGLRVALKQEGAEASTYPTYLSPEVPITITA
jgi:hypothetical protein